MCSTMKPKFDLRYFKPNPKPNPNSSRLEPNFIPIHTILLLPISTIAINGFNTFLFLISLFSYMLSILT